YIRRSNFFFFQAEDGIRDFHVTGVQTCALPILTPRTWPGSVRWRCAVNGRRTPGSADRAWRVATRSYVIFSCKKAQEAAVPKSRSEERRVGKEWRSRWWT